MPPSVLSSSRQLCSSLAPLRLFEDASTDFLLVSGSDYLFDNFRVASTVLTELQLACEPELACDPDPDVSVEFELNDVFVSELNVRTKGAFCTGEGEIGGVDIRELSTESESLSSVVDVFCMERIKELRGGLIGAIDGGPFELSTKMTAELLNILRAVAFTEFSGTFL